MIRAPGSVVMCRSDVGTVTRVLAGGLFYKVDFPRFGEIPCMADALKDAPENVVPFRRRSDEHDGRNWL